VRDTYPGIAQGEGDTYPGTSHLGIHPGMYHLGIPPCIYPTYPPWVHHPPVYTVLVNGAVTRVEEERAPGLKVENSYDYEAQRGLPGPKGVTVVRKVLRRVLRSPGCKRMKDWIECG